MSNIDSFANRSPLKGVVSRNVVSVYEISAVNLIVPWLVVCLFNELRDFGLYAKLRIYRQYTFSRQVV